MTSFALLSVLVCVAACFGLVSHRVLRLPTSTGTAILSLAASAALVAGGDLLPGLRSWAVSLVQSIDFNQVVLHGMLAFLLFAGALRLDLEQLSREKLTVASLALFGTALSIVLVAWLLRVVFGIVGIHIDLFHALLFGALISPTDPTAVLDMLRRVGAPASLEAQLAGESLFNDGIGAVIFLTLLTANRGGGTLPSPERFALVLVLHAGGAIALGLALGYLTYRLIRMVDSYRIEVMLTLALAMGGYALADGLRLSAPLEVVAAGLMVSGSALRLAMSEKTRVNVDRFWELTDDILNVVLYLLLGLELLVIPLQGRYLVAGIFAIPVVLAARWLSVSCTLGTLSLVAHRKPHSILLLTWGGLRGALAVALALALPQGGGVQRALLLITYVVVVFSIVVQGLTIAPLVRKMHPATDPAAPSMPR